MNLLRNKIKDEQIEALKIRLQYDEFVINLLSRIVEQTQNIKISDLITPPYSSRVDVYNLPGIDIVVHNELKQRKKINSEMSCVHKNTKQTTACNISNRTEKIRKNIDMLLNTTQTYKDVKNFDTIKENRKSLLGVIDINEYVRMIVEHYDRIKKISKIKNLKINTHNYFTPLEHRLGFLEDYTNISLDSDETIKFINTFCGQQLEDLLPFSHELLYKKCANYSLALIPVESMIQKIFENNGNNKNYNLVYFHHAKSKANDPYSFYYLGQVKENGEKHWKLDLRLWNISSNLGNSLIMYCITLFRRIYYDVFKDNNFRSDYNSYSDITAECEQLFSNIVYISHKSNFCKLMQKMVMDHASRTTEEDDKLNLITDDKYNKKTFADFGENEANSNIIENISRLFDDPDKERLIRIIKCKKIK